MEALDRLSAAIGLVLLAYAILAAVLVAFLGFRCTKNERQIPVLEGVFVALSLAVMIFAWLPLIAYNLPLNPDEAEMIANAQKFTEDMMTWRSVDTSTSGPLNSMVLMWPFLFGEGVSIPVARLTTVLLAAGTWLCTYFCLTGSQASIRVGILATFAMFLAGAQFFDFTHYSSERLPAFFLAIATLIMMAIANGQSGKRLPILLFVAGLALGSVPFAKLQAGPMAVVLGAGVAGQVLLIESSWRTKFGRLAILGFGALAVPAFILAPLAATEGLTDFWISYIDWALRYASAAMTSLTGFVFMITPDDLLSAFMLSTACVFLIGIVFWAVDVDAIPWRQRVAVGFLILLVATAVYVVVRPGRGFNHYAFLVVAPLAALAGAVWPRRAELSKTVPIWPMWLGAAIPVAALLLQGSHALSANHGRRLEIMGAENFFRSGDLLDWLPALPPRMLVWGWMPDWYVYSGLIPATRDIQTNNQIRSFQIHYFRRRLLSDFDLLQTSVVVDACVPESFACKTSASGLTRFPEFNAVVAKNFAALTSNSAPEIPTTYLRNDLVPELRKSLVRIGAISASSYLEMEGTRFLPERVNDFSVYDSRNDHWLLPDGKEARLEASLDGLQPVSEIWILNTRNGFRGDRATRDIYVDLLAKGMLLYRTRVKLKRFPYWTRLKVSQAGMPADGLRITILKFAGKGGGLNEIKLLTPYGAKRQAATDRAVSGSR